jgi:hypothetical protein
LFSIISMPGETAIASFFDAKICMKNMFFYDISVFPPEGGMGGTIPPLNGQK